MWAEPVRLRPAAPLNVVWDGNSLVYGTGSTGEGTGLPTTLPAQVDLLLRRRFTDVRVANCGIAGQSWADMAARADDVRAAYVPGRINLLVLWETTNSICNSNRSAPAAAADAQAYVADRLAERPDWRILLLGSIPRQAGPAFGNDPPQATIDAFNTRLIACDALIRAGCRAWGARGYVDLRGTGSPFALPDYSPASFAANDPLWAERAGGRVHFTDAGYAIVAGLVARAIGNFGAR